MKKSAVLCLGVAAGGILLLSGCCAIPHALSMFGKDKDNGNSGCMMMGGHAPHDETVSDGHRGGTPAESPSHDLTSE